MSVTATADQIKHSLTTRNGIKENKRARLVMKNQPRPNLKYDLCCKSLI